MSKLFLRITLAICVAFSSQAFANTIVVDGAGGGAFTAIQPAVDAAQPGDVVVVMPGYYASFNLTKSLTVVGSGAVYVVNSGGTISIANIGAGQRAILSNLLTFHVSATNCAGHVMLLDFHANDGSVSQCADLRCNRSSIAGGLTIAASRLELARQTVPPSLGPNFVLSVPQPGPAGMRCTGSSRVHVALSQVTGVVGESTQFGFTGGDGGAGIELGTSDLVILAASHVIGGTEGYGFPHPTQPQCALDGIPGPGIRFLSPTAVQLSGSTIDGAMGFDQFCNPIVGAQVQGTGTLTPIAPDDPTLEMLGTPSPGGLVQVVVRAPAGSVARLRLGRNPVLVADGLTEIEQLAGTARQVNLGIVPPSGQISVGWNLPLAWSVGTFAVLQADITLSGGGLRRTNSVPVLAR